MGTISEFAYRHKEKKKNLFILIEFVGRVAGIATDYGLDGPGSNTGGDEIFRPSRPALAHLASCKMGTGSFPGVKCSRGVLLTTHPLLVPRSWKSRAIPLPTLWATPGLWREHFTFFILIEFKSLAIRNSNVIITFLIIFCRPIFIQTW